MSYWLFQGNPKSYRVLDGIRDFDELYWQVTRYTKELQPGDQVAIWVAGRGAGVYALAELTTTPNGSAILRTTVTGTMMLSTFALRSDCMSGYGSPESCWTGRCCVRI